MKDGKYRIGTMAIHGGQQKILLELFSCTYLSNINIYFDSAEQGGKRFALEECGYIIQD